MGSTRRPPGAVVTMALDPSVHDLFGKQVNRIASDEEDRGCGAVEPVCNLVPEHSSTPEGCKSPKEQGKNAVLCALQSSCASFKSPNRQGCVLHAYRHHERR